MREQIEIKIEGNLDAHWQHWFENFTISSCGNTTILSGTVIDESEKYGVLNKLRDLNLRLLSFTTLTNN